MLPACSRESIRLFKMISRSLKKSEVALMGLNSSMEKGPSAIGFLYIKKFFAVMCTRGSCLFISHELNRFVRFSYLILHCFYCGKGCVKGL